MAHILLVGKGVSQLGRFELQIGTEQPTHKEVSMKSAVTVLVTISVGIFFSACSLVQRTMPGSTMSNAEILGLLNTIDHSEIDAGQLALQKASSPEVRSFASRMVSEHEMMMENIGRLAHRLSVQPQKPALASTMEDTHRNSMETLGAKSGSDFDKAYIAYQVTMHEQAVDLVGDVIGSVENQDLKLYLRQTKPDLQNHLVSSQSIERQVVAQQ